MKIVDYFSSEVRLEIRATPKYADVVAVFSNNEKDPVSLVRLTLSNHYSSKFVLEVQNECVELSKSKVKVEED